jgi:hypothetical protein
VDHRKKFIDVFCGEPGSFRDARLRRKSSLYAKMVQSKDFDKDLMENSFLIGDLAYPNLYWLITPFKDNRRLT